MVERHGGLFRIRAVSRDFMRFSREQEQKYPKLFPGGNVSYKWMVVSGNPWVHGEDDTIPFWILAKDPKFAESRQPVRLVKNNNNGQIWTCWGVKDSRETVSNLDTVIQFLERSKIYTYKEWPADLPYLDPDSETVRGFVLCNHFPSSKSDLVKKLEQPV